MTQITLSPIMLEALRAANTKSFKINPVLDYDRPARIPSGSIALDYALGGGWPRGRVSIMRGDESFGKSTLATLMAAYVTSHPSEMKNGGLVAYIDVEGTYDPHWAECLGIDPSRIALIQPERGEDALETVLALVRANCMDAIIYDTIAATALTAVMEGSMDDNHVGLLARKLGLNFFPALTPALRKSDVAVILINQMREKIGVTHGSNESQPGGRALRHAASINVLVYKKPERMPLDYKKPQVGMKLFARTTKNKTAPARLEAEVTLNTQHGYFGVSLEPELAAVGRMLGVFVREDGSPISGSCSWFFDGAKLATGEKAVTAELMTNSALCGEVEARVREAIALGTAGSDGIIMGDEE